MLGLILQKIGILAAGSSGAYAVIMSISWLKKKVKEKLAQKKAKKVAFGDLKVLIQEAAMQSDNKIKMEDLEKIEKEGYTNYMATIDNEGEILGKVELIKDENETLDVEIEELLSRDRSRLVIFES